MAMAGIAEASPVWVDFDQSVYFSVGRDAEGLPAPLPNDVFARSAPQAVPPTSHGEVFVSPTGPSIAPDGTNQLVFSLAILGLVPSDNLDALSGGADGTWISGRHLPGVLLFSVDPNAVGMVGSDVREEAVDEPPPDGDPGNEAAGDVFKSRPTAPFGSWEGTLIDPAKKSNDLIVDENALGLQAPANAGLVPPEDDLDALETEGGPGIFFSLDSASPSIGGAVTPDDILLSPFGPFGIYADGVTIGLVPGDDLDALVLSDAGTSLYLDPGVDEALFSLAPGSPSLYGPDGIPGTADDWSPGDVFYTNFTGGFGLYASHDYLGLEFGDNLNALDIKATPEPASMLLLGFGLVGLAGYALRRRRNKK
ncbi:PEP-CTERM sorting domain-containing protein [Candidatus Poribacteria bacterium]|nr:PEP-CTERM sorting domain-containing protein [Candidatus Poribacteria bacterium]